MKTKPQPHYDKPHFNGNQELVGDEMTLLGMIAWVIVIGSFLGWIFYEAIFANQITFH